MAEFLGKMPIEKLLVMASTYTEGYRKGFEIAGIDLTKKKTVQIRYHIGFEPMVRQAVLQFEKMGLKPVFTRKTNTQAVGVVSTSPNKQYQYDHRFDDALYLNHALVQERLKISEKVFELYREEASLYAGPAVIEVFGEKLFSPKVKKESPAYKKSRRSFRFLTAEIILCSKTGIFLKTLTASRLSPIRFRKLVRISKIFLRKQ